MKMIIQQLVKGCAASALNNKDLGRVVSRMVAALAATSRACVNLFESTFGLRNSRILHWSSCCRAWLFTASNVVRYDFKLASGTCDDTLGGVTPSFICG